MNYLIDVLAVTGKGTNEVVGLLHHFLRHMILEKHSAICKLKIVLGKTENNTVN